MLPIRYTSIDSIRQWTVMGGRMPSKSSQYCEVPRTVWGSSTLLGRPDTDQAGY